MSNDIYIARSMPLNPTQITEVLEHTLNGLVAGWNVKYFPQNPDDPEDYACWLAKHPAIQHDGLDIELWTDTFGVPESFDEATDTFKEYWPCVTIRSGRFDFWYWLLDCIVWELSQKWQVVVWNDGVYTPKKPGTTFKEHYREWSARKFPHDPEMAACHFNLKMKIFEELELPGLPKTDLWKAVIG